MRERRERNHVNSITRAQALLTFAAFFSVFDAVKNSNANCHLFPKGRTRGFAAGLEETPWQPAGSSGSEGSWLGRPRWSSTGLLTFSVSLPTQRLCSLSGQRFHPPQRAPTDPVSWLLGGACEKAGALDNDCSLLSGVYTEGQRIPLPRPQLRLLAAIAERTPRK